MRRGVGLILRVRDLAITLAVATGALLSSQAACADDADDERLIREDLFPELAGLPDGASIRATFERAFAGDAGAASGLIGVLGHSDEDVARFAAHILGRFPSPQAASALKLRFATDSRSPVRLGALSGLARMGDGSAAELAISALSSPDGLMQLGGLATLGELKDSRNSAVILQYLDGPFQVDVRDIFDALGELGDAPGSTAVRDRLVTEANKKAIGWDTRLDAALALQALGQGDLVRPILNRVDAINTYGRLRALFRKIKDLARSRSLAIDTQGQVNALLAEADVGAQGKEDYWGRPLRGKFVSRGIFEVISDGPDRTPGTTDDMSTAESFAVYDNRVFGGLL